jgi:hypothetical protein
MIGDTYGTWRIVRESTKHSGNRQQFLVRCIHCGSERQMQARHVRTVFAWHRGCLVRDPHVSERMSRARGSSHIEPSESPQWALLSDELDRHPDAEGWPAALLENVLAWRDCRRMDAQALTLEDHASARREGWAVP